MGIYIYIYIREIIIAPLSTNFVGIKSNLCWVTGWGRLRPLSHAKVHVSSASVKANLLEVLLESRD